MVFLGKVYFFAISVAIVSGYQFSGPFHIEVRLFEIWWQIGC
jgi:hypothetical protein